MWDLVAAKKNVTENGMSVDRTLDHLSMVHCDDRSALCATASVPSPSLKADKVWFQVMAWIMGPSGTVQLELICQ